MGKDDNDNLKNLAVVGDRVLIKPRKMSNKSKGKEELLTGYIVKCGPGYPVSLASEDPDELWKRTSEPIKYIPLQTKVGDLAIFLQKAAIEIIFNDEKYFIVPQSSILLIERDEEFSG
jgi:co-chaperonin GroES (HSP10)